MEHPHIVILAGPNGAGKSTAAPHVLRDTLNVTEFVNADVLAQGLSGFDVEGAAMTAGRIMLKRLRELASRRIHFAFETTLATKGFAPWLRGLISEEGYAVHLAYLWLPRPDTAVQRVATRVRLGGHNVPPETVARRYQRSLWNFQELYAPLAMTWQVYDSAEAGALRPVARREYDNPVEIIDESLWKAFQAAAAR